MASVELTPQLAEFLGIYVGDGCMSLVNSNGEAIMEIAGSMEETGWITYVANLLWKVFGKRVVPRPHSSVYSIQTSENRICRFLEEQAGFPIGKKSLTVRAPSIVMGTRNLEVYSSFLRGYFDADGCLNFERRTYGKYADFKRTYHYYPRLLISSVSKNLILGDIREMLEFIGMRHSLFEKRPSSKGKHQVYGVVLKGAAQLETWKQTIDFSNPVHLTKYQIWKYLGFCPPKTTLNQRLRILSGESHLLEELYGGPAGI